MDICEYCDSNIEDDYTFCPYCGVPTDEIVTEKEKVWLSFAARVASEVIPEAVEEYGDFDDDESLENHSVEDLLGKLSELALRYKHNGFEKSDILHLAHFPALIYYKRNNE